MRTHGTLNPVACLWCRSKLGAFEIYAHCRWSKDVIYQDDTVSIRKFAHISREPAELENNITG